MQRAFEIALDQVGAIERGATSGEMSRL